MPITDQYSETIQIQIIYKWARALHAAASATNDPLDSWDSLSRLLCVPVTDLLNWRQDEVRMPPSIAKKIELLAGPNGEFIAKMIAAQQPPYDQYHAKRI